MSMMQLAEGTLIDGRFRILRPIGEGGMATVFEAENTRLGNRFALKFMSGAVQNSRTGIERFLREASTLASLKHPNIVQVFDIVVYNDVPVIVMELLQGESLAQRTDRGWRPNSAELIELAQSMLEALSHAHSQQFIHRDIKPDNIFAEQLRGGRLVWRLMDFGIARSAADQGLTSTGQFIGTRRYASPEQIQDPRNIDARADLFSLGVTLWEAATGLVPWERVDSEFELMKAITAYPGYTIDGGGFDPRLEMLIRALTCNDRNRRVPDAATALRLLAAPAPIQAQPRQAPPMQAQPRQAPPMQAQPMQPAAMVGPGPWRAPAQPGPPTNVAPQYAQAAPPPGWYGAPPPAQPMVPWQGGQFPAAAYPGARASAPQTGFWAGRIGRMKYFWHGVGLTVVAFSLALPPLMMVEYGHLSEDVAMPILFAGAAIWTVFSARLIVQRLHDLGHHGILVIPYLVTAMIPVANLVVGLYLLFAPGNPGPNKYGAPPT